MKNKRMRKIAVLLMLILGVLLFVSCDSRIQSEETEALLGEEPQTGEGLLYTLSEDGTYYIVSGIGTCTDTELVIPSTNKGLPVKEIGESAFSLSYLSNGGFEGARCRSIVIPDSVEVIAERAFSGNTFLRSITIGRGVEQIAGSAFSYCRQLVEVINKSAVDISLYEVEFVTVGDTVIEIHDGDSKLVQDEEGYLFYSCEKGVYLIGYAGEDAEEVTKLTLPKSYNGHSYDIHDYAFWNYQTLTEVDIPNGVKQIGDCAFYGTCLVDVDLPEGLTHIGSYAFCTRNSLISIEIPDSVTTIGYGAFMGTSSNYRLSLSKIPAGMTKIGSGAFNGCAFSNIIIPESVTSIEVRAFSQGSIGSVVIHKGVTYIDKRAFEDCSLWSVAVDSDNANYCVIDGILYNKAGTEIVCVPNGLAGDVIIPENVTQIDSRAFYGCENITSVTFLGAITSIGEYAFGGCSSLAAIDLPESITAIGSSAFFNCSSLTVIDLPESITTIGDRAFSGCEMLTSIVLSDGVTEIGESAFSDCINLSDVKLPRSLTKINDFVFSGCQSLTSVDIPENVTEIGGAAFLGCTHLTNISLPENIANIDPNAFRECNELVFSEYINGLYLGNSNNPYLVLYDVKSNGLTVLIVHEDTKMIFADALSDCKSLKTISLPSGLQYIGDGALKNCGKLDFNEYDNALYLGNENSPYLVLVKASDDEILSCNIHETTRILYQNAFSSCCDMISITVPQSVVSIGEDVFNNSCLVEIINLSNCDIAEKENSLPEVHSGESKIVDQNGFYFYSYNGTHYLLGYNGSQTELALPENYNGEGYIVRKYAKCNDASLTSVTIPAAATFERVVFFFENCVTLENINVDSEHPMLCSVDGVLYNKEKTDLLYIPSKISGNLSIPYGVTEISHSFENLENLTSVTLPEGMTDVDLYFSNCPNLKSVSIPESMTHSNALSFSKCDSLQFNTYDNALYLGNDSNPYLLLYKAKDTDITTCRVHENAKIIFDNAFKGCDKLTSIPIPNSVTIVGETAFDGCTSLSYNSYDNGLYLGNETNPYRVWVSAKDESVAVCEIHEDVSIILGTGIGKLTDITFYGTEKEFYSALEQLSAKQFTRTQRTIKRYCEIQYMNKTDE